MSLHSYAARACGVAILAGLLASASPAEAATRTCVADAYNHLWTTPAGAYRHVKVSINGIRPVSAPGASPGTAWAYFGKTFLEVGYDSGVGGQLLKNSAVHSPFSLWYDTISESYFDQPSQGFSFQSIPLDDAYPVRLSGVGAVFEIAAKCYTGSSSLQQVLSGFDQYGHFWSMVFYKSPTSWL